MEPPRIGAWAQTHAMMPFVRRTRDGIELIFSCRDGQARSHTARADLHMTRTRQEVSVATTPLLSPGPLGAFDDSGAIGSCVVSHQGREYLYYVGWSRAVTVPFVLSIGCAVSENGGATFERVSRAPVLGRSEADPFLATAPWVLREGGRWRMWYTSGVRWVLTDGTPKHFYRIVHAQSPDGVTWTPSGGACIDFADDDEYAIGRPCVVRDAGGYRMWFSYRGPAYRIGYAESDDGLVWRRDDERGGLAPTGEGWESASVEYACVFDHAGSRWMLYNGDGYGATGVGLAVQERAA